MCRKPSDPAHIRSRGAGGDDHDDNVVSLCRSHHSEQHQVGWVRFVTRYPKVGFALANKGWVVRESNGLHRLVRAEEFQQRTPQGEGEVNATE